MQLTKEHFDTQIKKLVSKADLDRQLALLDERFEHQTRLLMAYSDQQNEKLAAMVAEGFEEITGLLDVREQVKQLQVEVKKLVTIQQAHL